MDIEIKDINLRLQKEDKEKNNTTPVKQIDLSQPSGKRTSLSGAEKKKFLTGGHKRTLSGVVADVSNLNKNTITNKEYNFADLLGDINYINDDG